MRISLRSASKGNNWVMDWKPWQVWSYIGWGVLTLVVVGLFLVGSVNGGVLLTVMIIGCSAAAVRVLLDRRDRNRIQNQEPD